MYLALPYMINQGQMSRVWGSKKISHQIFTLLLSNFTIHVNKPYKFNPLSYHSKIPRADSSRTTWSSWLRISMCILWLVEKYQISTLPQSILENLIRIAPCNAFWFLNKANSSWCFTRLGDNKQVSGRNLKQTPKSHNM